MFSPRRLKPATAALLIGLGALSAKGLADIPEERLATGSNLFVPTAFPLNPAANANNLTLVGIQQSKRDERTTFVVNPGGGNQAAVDEKVAKKDLALGGQYPLGGASFGLNYSEYRRSVSVDNENRTEKNHEDFVNRDYRMKFGVDFTSDLRGAFTFHYTALKADLAGSFDIGNQDRTGYHGSMSGYGIGLYYQIRNLGLGLFTHPPMRGKATVEGEQKIVSEPGVYGFNTDFKAMPRLNLAFNYIGWSYKHDERDERSTSPVNQSNILLRGLDLNQFYRKTSAFGLAGEYALTPLIFVKGQYQRQQGVFLFDPDHVPGDDRGLETRVRYPEYRLGAGVRSKDFIAELGFLMSKASEGSIKSRTGFGDIGSYASKATALTLMIGAAF